MGLEQYQGDMDMCCRCSTCKFIPMQQVKGEQYVNVCPSIARYNFHAYSAGGRLNIGSVMLKEGFNYTDRLLDIVYNCQMCGACGVSCNYAMDMEVLNSCIGSRTSAASSSRPNRCNDIYSQWLVETMPSGFSLRPRPWWYASIAPSKSCFR